MFCYDSKDPTTPGPLLQKEGKLLIRLFSPPPAGGGEYKRGWIFMGNTNYVETNERCKNSGCVTSGFNYTKPELTCFFHQNLKVGRMSLFCA